jgi:hypothetical protein
MDKMHEIFIDTVTGTYGDVGDIMIVKLSSAELFYMGEYLSDSERIEYAKSVGGHSL